jgi:hypothetical protein
MSTTKNKKIKRRKKKKKRIKQHRKICIYCNKRKNPQSFPRHSAHKDELDSRCRECKTAEEDLRKEIRKIAPPVTGCCESCNKLFIKKTKDSDRLDHCRKTKKFRGWLCDGCNTGIGKLGDSIQGVLNALNYLLLRSDIDRDELPVLINGATKALNNLLFRKNYASEKMD